MMGALLSSELFSSPYFIAAAALGLIGALLVITGIAALWRARPLGFAVRTLTGLVFALLGLLAGGLAAGIHGYRALTHEEVAARVTVEPTGRQRFNATFEFADGRRQSFELAGDEIYIDAHILKWKPYANVVGLHTAYELDRVAGRYRGIADERVAARTIHALGPERPVDLFDLRRRYAFLSPLLDAEYGSATFIPVARTATLELRVSATGLLIRDTAAPGK
jgi:hypothetical protein